MVAGKFVVATLLIVVGVAGVDEAGVVESEAPVKVHRNHCCVAKTATKLHLAVIIGDRGLRPTFSGLVTSGILRLLQPIFYNCKLSPLSSSQIGQINHLVFCVSVVDAPADYNRIPASIARVPLRRDF